MTKLTKSDESDASQVFTTTITLHFPKSKRFIFHLNASFTNASGYKLEIAYKLIMFLFCFI